MKKYLRSILCLVLALCMVMCFAACSDKDKDDEEEEEVDGISIAGTYVLDSVTADGETLSAEDLEDLGFTEDTFYIILNKDGTGTVCLEGDVAEITWDDEELTDSDGEALPYTVKGTKLTIEIDGDTMTFKKTDKKITTSQPADEEDDKPTVTSTTYGIYAVTASGITVSGADLTAAGMTPSDTYITLNSDNTGILCITGESEEVNWNGSKMWAPNDPTDLVDMLMDGDVLTVSIDGTSMVFLKNGSSQVPNLSTAPAGSVVGKYSLYSFSDGTTTYDGATLDMVLSALEIESRDDYMYLELFADGTGKLVPMGIEGAIEYNETQLWPQGQSSESIPYTFENGLLSFTLDEYTYVMQQQ